MKEADTKEPAQNPLLHYTQQKMEGSWWLILSLGWPKWLITMDIHARQTNLLLTTAFAWMRLLLNIDCFGKRLENGATLLGIAQHTQEIQNGSFESGRLPACCMDLDAFTHLTVNNDELVSVHWKSLIVPWAQAGNSTTSCGNWHGDRVPIREM